MNWKITIRPNKTGIRIRTQSTGGSDAEASLIENAVLLALTKLNKRLRK